MAGKAAITHNIELAGQGYIVARDTYRQSSQAPLIQRVAMGEVDLTSVNNFQYERQDDFTGGKEQKTFADPYSDAFESSYGFKPKDIEELRLLRAVEKCRTAVLNKSILVAFAGNLWLADRTQAKLEYSANGTTWSTFGLPTGYGGAIGGIGVVHGQEGAERLLVMSATGIFFCIKPDLSVDTAYGDANGVKDYSSVGGTWSQLIEWGHAIYVGHDAGIFRRAALEGSTIRSIFPNVWTYEHYLEPALEALLGTSAYTPPAHWFDSCPAGLGDVVCMIPALNPQRLCVGSYDSSTKTSYITILDGGVEFPTDSGDALMFTPALMLPDFEIQSMAPFQGQLIYGGRKRIAGRDVGHVYAYPRRLIAEIGKDLSDAFDYSVGAMAVHEDVLFAINNNVQSDGKHAPGLMALTEKGYYNGPQPAAFTKATSTIIDAIASFKDEIYWVVRGVGIYRGSSARTFVTAARLESSRYDKRMKVVDKKWLDLELRLGSALSGDQEIVVKYQTAAGGAWATLFTMTSSDGVSVVGTFPAALISKWIKVALEFSQSTTDADIVVESLMLRMVIVADGKLEWSFEIKAEDSLELLDSAEDNLSMEILDGLQLMQAIRTAYVNRQPVEFEDIDQETYTVMVTQFAVGCGEIEHPTVDDLEFGAVVELVEV